MNYQLLQVIDQLYTTFEKYTILSDLRGRSCECCVSDEEIRLLLSKRLKDLDDDDIGHFLRSAITTYGDLNDFKHFLPRILELMKNPDSEVFGDFLTFEKLNYSDWKTWNKNEVIVIENFFVALWIEIISKEDSSFGTIKKGLLLMINYVGIDKALFIWENSNSKKAMIYIVESSINGFEIKLKDEDWDKLSKWLSNERLLKKIEDLFFETKNKSEANRISIAYTLLKSSVL